jgi:hypothetical protein
MTHASTWGRGFEVRSGGRNRAEQEGCQVTQKDHHVCWLAKIHFSLNKSLKTGLFFQKAHSCTFKISKLLPALVTFGPSARNLMSKGEGAGGHSVATRGDRPLINADGTTVGLGMFLIAEFQADFCCRSWRHRLRSRTPLEAVPLFAGWVRRSGVFRVNERPGSIPSSKE